MILQSGFLPRFKNNLFNKKLLKMCALFAAVIWILLAGIFLIIPSQVQVSPWIVIIDTGVHTYLISFSIYLTHSFYKALLLRKPLLKGFTLLVLSYSGVVAGELLAQSFSRLFCYGEDIPREIILRSLLFSMYVSTIFAGSFLAYEALHSKLERAMLIIKEKEVSEHLLKKLKAQAELQALQAKINPHFLFNTLNSIASLISVDPFKAEEAVEKLSRLFRFTLKNSNLEKVSLSESISYVRSYLELEKLRLGDRLQFDIHLRGNIESVFVQDLLIQPLVENSIKHGIAPKLDGGRIDIDIKVKESDVEIIVADNGIGWQDKVSDSGHGLVNIRQRLDLTYGKHYQMEILKSDGVTVKLKIPRRIDV